MLVILVLLQTFLNAILLAMNTDMGMDMGMDMDMDLYLDLGTMKIFHHRIHIANGTMMKNSWSRTTIVMIMYDNIVGYT